MPRSVRRIKTVLSLLRAAGIPYQRAVQYPRVFLHDPANYTGPRLAYLKAHQPGRHVGCISMKGCGCQGSAAVPAVLLSLACVCFQVLETIHKNHLRPVWTLPCFASLPPRNPSVAPGSPLASALCRAEELQLVSILSRSDAEFAEARGNIPLEEYLLFKVCRALSSLQL